MEELQSVSGKLTNATFAQLEFTTRLSSLLQSTAAEGNVLFSPIIIYQHLVIFYLGSSGQTRVKLQKLIRDDDAG